MPRFNYELGADAAEMLNTLAQWTDRTRRSDVVRDALAVYEALARRAREGNRFFYGPDSKRLTELDIASLTRAREKAERRPDPESAISHPSPRPLGRKEVET